MKKRKLNRVKKAKGGSAKSRRKIMPKAKSAKPRKAQVKGMPGAAEAKEVNDLHGALVGEFADFASQSVSKVMEIGTKLRLFKKAVGHGYWQQWVNKHLDFDIRTASRYLAVANPKRTPLADLKECTTLMAAYAVAGIPPKHTTTGTAALRVFSPGAMKLLNQPIEAIAEGNKATFRAEFERFESIAVNFYDHPSIFAVIWQKKFQEPPTRWARKDIELFKNEIAKAQEILAAIEADAQFDAGPAGQEVQVEETVLIEGDAP